MIRLPSSTSLLTIGREFDGIPNIVMIGFQNRLLRVEDAIPMFNYTC